MKSGRKTGRVKEILKERGRDAVMAWNCGMPDEKRYYSADAMPEEAGYFALIIAK